MSTAIEPLTRLGGQGPDIVLLHGYGADRQSWLATAPALFEHTTVWATDLPSHGTRAAHPGGDGRIDTLTDHIAESIHLTGLERYHLIGHSLGGRLALELTRRDPASTLSMILLAPAGVGAGINEKFLTDFANADDPDSIVTLLRTLTHDPRLITQTLGTGVLKYLETPGTRASLHAIAQGLLDVQTEVDALLQSINVVETPRMSIWGNNDQINPPDSQKIDALGGSSHLLTDCGHLPHIEKRVKVNQLITEFLDKQIE